MQSGSIGLLVDSLSGRASPSPGRASQRISYSAVPLDEVAIAKGISAENKKPQSARSQVTSPRQLLDDNKKIIQCSEGTFWVADAYGNVTTVSNKADGVWEEFEILPSHCGRAVFRSNNGKFASIADDGRLRAGGLNPVEAELFEIVPVRYDKKSGKVYLKSKDGRYMVAHRDGRLYAERDAKNRENAMFHIICGVERLRLTLQCSRAKESKAMKHLEMVGTFWDQKREQLEGEIEKLGALVKEQENALDEVEHPREEAVEDIPPGPSRLRFIQGTTFTLFSAVVVVVNLGTMVAEMMHPSLKTELYWFDQAILAFYIVEFTLKYLLFKHNLLCGRWHTSWWNWLDLIIVVVGILDQWALPVLESANIVHRSHGSIGLQLINMLRMARLARILKTVRAFMASDLSWAEGEAFQLFIMSVIGFNSFMMSFESDFPDFFGWFYLEQLLLCIFSFELLVRLRHWGFKFFLHPTDLVWNLLDFVIVTGGIVDQWLMPAIAIVQTCMGMEAGSSSSMGQVMMMLRLARLLRILRLVRLVKSIPPLFTLITGIIQAMQGMTWVVALTTVCLYAFALLSVRLIGHGLVFGGEAPEEIVALFPNVAQSMFVWFEAMNGNSDLLEPLFRVMPMSKLVYILWMVTSSWAILSILTAVVSENMINATEAHREEQEALEKAHHHEFSTDMLRELFAASDEDQTGTLDEAAFQKILDNPTKADVLISTAGLQREELEQMFDLLSSQEESEDGQTLRYVRYAEFIEGLENENRAVRERAIMRLEKRMMEVAMAVEKLKKGLAGTLDAGVLIKELSCAYESKLQSLTQRFALFQESHLESLAERVLAKLDWSRAESALTTLIGKLDKQLDAKKADTKFESLLLKLEQRLDSCKEDSTLKSLAAQMQQREARDLESLSASVAKLEKIVDLRVEGSRRESIDAEGIVAKLENLTHLCSGARRDSIDTDAVLAKLENLTHVCSVGRRDSVESDDILAKLDHLTRLCSWSEDCSGSVFATFMDKVQKQLEAIAADCTMEAFQARLDKKSDSRSGGSSTQPIGVRELPTSDSNPRVDAAIETLLAKLESGVNTGQVTPSKGSDLIRHSAPSVGEARASTSLDAVDISPSVTSTQAPASTPASPASLASANPSKKLHDRPAVAPSPLLGSDPSSDSSSSRTPLRPAEHYVERITEGTRSSSSPHTAVNAARSADVAPNMIEGP